MTQKADTLLKKVFGQNMISSIPEDVLRKLRNNMERMIQERGAEIAEAHIRKSQEKASRTASQTVGNSKDDEKVNIYDLGAAALMMMAISESMSTAAERQNDLTGSMRNISQDTHDFEDDMEDHEEDSPFFMKPPKPSFA